MGAHTGTREFHSFFYNQSVGRYGGDEDAILSLSLPALKIGSPPTALHTHVVETVGDHLKTINYTMAVGAVTSKILFNLLSENGLHETALRAATTTEEPSIGHWWKQWNATTCYEAFPGANNATNSHGSLNHIFLSGASGTGCGSTWWGSRRPLLGSPRLASTLASTTASGPDLWEGNFCRQKE